MNRSVLARQMFANGGQAVPNEYKGFSRLPEAVQMKLDPEAASKIRRRRHAGMMPPDMAPPPAMPQGQGMAEGVMDPQVLEGLLGQAQQNMDNLDDAEDYATVINSIRGEDAPI